MANFANNSTGFEQAQALVLTRMASKTWVEGHAAHDASGNTIVRYIRFMSATHPDYGAWVESRDTAAT